MWYLAALIVVPAFFVLAELGMKRIDPWMRRHRVGVYSAGALFYAAMLITRGMEGGRRVGDWLVMALQAFLAVPCAVIAVRARQAAE